MFKFLRHLFIPYHDNNHRSKLLHNTSLFVLIASLVLLTSLSIFVRSTNPQILGISYSISSQELTNLVNQERVQRGLNALKFNQALSNAAGAKAQDMFANKYWAHFGPNGASPWKFIKSEGYRYIYAGENLAKGFTTSTDAVGAWMGSKSHRDNILSPQYTDIGYAILEGNLDGEETVLIVQMLGSRGNQVFADSNAAEDVKNLTNTFPGVNNNVINNAIAGEASLGTVGFREISRGTIEQGGFSVSPFIDLIFGSKVISFVVLSMLLIALFFDFAIVERRKIPRIVGNNIDHIILILLFMVFLFVRSAGSIL